MKYFAQLLLICSLLLLCACSSYQPTKNVWKTTKSLWNTYVSQTASVNYENTADLPPESMALSRDMQGIDLELTRLERTMQNADKPPTQEWLNQLFEEFPWLNGFAGVKYNGQILGQQPPDSMKNLDFNPLLYEDKKQNSRALRADIEPSPLGAEVMLATPLYDGVDFLGIVVAYFDMRSLMRFSENPQDIVILTPNALLWPGKYDFAATPLAGVDWTKTVMESSAGTCSNSTGTFIYIVRYFANLPLIFAILQKGDFPEGNGGIEQGFAYFPQSREKTPPPDLPERKNRNLREDLPFAHSEEGELAEALPEGVEEPEVRTAAQENRPSPNEIQPGSRESVLLKNAGAKTRRQIQERQLEGENVEVQRVQQPRRRMPVPEIIIPEEPAEIPAPVTPQYQRPSPFGPAPQREEENIEQPRPYKRPSPFGPPSSTEERTSPAVSSPDNADKNGANTEDSAGTPAQPESAVPSPSTPHPETSGDEGEPLADGETVDNTDE